MSDNLLFDQALVLHQSGRVAEAEELYQRVLQQQPDHPGALHLLGVVRQQQGDYEAARELIGRAIAINPRKAVYQNNHGAALQSLGRHEEALERFERALAICPAYADALSNRGMAQASLGEDAAAVASFRAALAVQPGHADTTRQLASLVRHLGMGEEAVRLYEETLPHCSAAALAAPLSKLRIFAGQVDTQRQLAAGGRCDLTYRGSNPLLEVAVGGGDANRALPKGSPHCDPLRGTRAAGRGEGEISAGLAGASGWYGDSSVGLAGASGWYGDSSVGLAGASGWYGDSSAGLAGASGWYGDSSAGLAGASGWYGDRLHGDPAAPMISVIMPVYNAATTIQRAIRSLQAQTFPDWEALAVDDASGDESWQMLQAAAAADARIRVSRLEVNSGPSAARNAGLREARGEFIAYLDADDEYHPNYLEQLVAARSKGDVLMFGFDMVYEYGPPQSRTSDWDPRHVRRILFAFNPVVPLAVAHRRSLLNKVGGFHELISRQEDWDLWKRMARAGAKFAFLPGKSGVYHVRPGTLSQVYRLAERQREAILANWAARRPIFAAAEPCPHLGPVPLFRPRLEGGRDTVRKIAFLSPHCLIDPTSPTATAVLDGLQLLANTGIECQALCGTRQNDDGEDLQVEEALDRRKMPGSVRIVRIGPFTSRMTFTVHGATPITLFHTSATHGNWRDEEEVAAFMTACDLFLKKQRPDAVWTYGGDAVSGEVFKLAKRLDIPIVFALHDLTHNSAMALLPFDFVVVPSEFARQHYWKTLGLACHVLPPVMSSQLESLPNGREARVPRHDPLEKGEEDCSYRLAAIYHDFFASVIHQPGPPLVPSPVANP